MNEPTTLGCPKGLRITVRTMKPSKLDSDRSNYSVCPIGPIPKIEAFHSGANFSKLNRPIIPKNIQFH